MDTAEVHEQLSKAVEVATVGAAHQLLPHPRTLTRGQPNEQRAHNSYRVAPLPPSRMQRQGRCVEYTRTWNVVVSVRLDVAQDQPNAFRRLMDVEDQLVAELSGLPFVDSPPRASYAEVDDGRFIELTLATDTSYRRTTG